MRHGSEQGRLHLGPLTAALLIALAAALGNGPHARPEAHRAADAATAGAGNVGVRAPHAATIGAAVAVVSGRGRSMVGGSATGPLAPFAPLAPPAGARQMSIPYNGRFTFTRIRYGSRGGFRRRGGDAWAHDYPNADLNLQTILSELTAVRPTLERSNVLDLEDREIFKYPILYMSEPGFWSVTDEGARNLREHLLKGGMIIFDDFETPYWRNFYTQIKRVMPDYELIEIDGSHPLFSSFFHIDDVYVPHPFDLTRPTYTVMFEDNDPTKRPMVISNLNADLAEYWEYSGRGWFPVDPTNDAYKIGVNYIIYALTH